jgi:hypothetical protein
MSITAIIGLNEFAEYWDTLSQSIGTAVALRDMSPRDRLKFEERLFVKDKNNFASNLKSIIDLSKKVQLKNRIDNII